MLEAFVTGELVTWARERYGLSAEVAAQKIKVPVDKLVSWEREDKRPTFRQAQNLAKAFHVPFGYLFLSAPPSEEIPLPDLRTVTGSPLRPPSPNFLDVVNDVLRKQRWYREYLESEGAQRIPFVGRFTISDSPEKIASDMASTLGISDAMRQESDSWEQFLQRVIQRAERVGVVVMRSGIVESNTHRTLDVEEFRGFAISDELAPLVFINGQDAKTAQIFSLAHELAHLWIGSSGISNPDHLRRPSQQLNAVDRLCDQVAAEVLLPKQSFEADWDESALMEGNLRIIASRYRVSKFVVLRRAYENNKISFDKYRDHYEQLVTNVRRRRGAQGGGDFYRTLLARNGSSLTFAVLATSAEGRISDREAAGLLNVKIKTVAEIRKRLLVGGGVDA